MQQTLLRSRPKVCLLHADEAAAYYSHSLVKPPPSRHGRPPKAGRMWRQSTLIAPGAIRVRFAATLFLDLRIEESAQPILSAAILV
jgi:hypothetical protein